MTDWKREEERLENARFVGRTAEQEQFRSLLRQPASRPRLLNVYGIGGIGKSRLLRMYETLARLEGTAFVMADFRDIAPLPEAFEAHLRHILSSGDDHPGDALQQLAAQRQVVLALDSYERAASIDGWLRDSFIPRLHAGILIVIAGRYALDGGWFRSAYWSRQMAKLHLEGFSEAEVGQFVSVYLGEEDEAFAAKVYA